MTGPVALTGATGFIGGALLQHLSRCGIPVRALTRRYRESTPATEWITGDLADAAALQRLVSGVRSIVHCAGAVRGNDAGEFDRINHAGTGTLARIAAAHAAYAPILLISSLAAREPGLSWYAASKRAAEQALAGTAADGTWTAFRPPAVYGPGDREIKPLIDLMRRGILPVPGNPGARFSLLHVHDLATAVSAWITGAGRAHGVYELHDGTPGGYDWHQLQELAQQAFARRVHLVTVPAVLLRYAASLGLCMNRIVRRPAMLTPGKARELVHPDWVCDNSRICEVLDWQPSIRFADALRTETLL